MSKKESIDSIGQRIKQARERRGYNQAQLASEAKITPSAISQIESGDRIPSTPILRRIASVLTSSTDFLLGNTNEIEFQDLLHDEKVQNFYRGFKELSTVDQQLIESQIEFLKTRKKK